MQRNILFSAAIAGFLAVALGAFGAHGLKHSLSDYELDIYKTAVNYHIWHALLLALIAALPAHKLLNWAARLLIIGIALFSGSLYLLAVIKVSWLGMITPLGGLAFLLAWGLLAVVAYQHKA